MRRRDDGKRKKQWDVFIPPEPPPKPVRSGAVRPPQRVIQQQQERAAVKRWNVAHAPTETLEKFYVSYSDKVGVCLIRETPDGSHPIVYVTSHPDELKGAPLAWCVSCRKTDCAGCVWALKSFNVRRRGAYDSGRNIRGRAQQLSDDFEQWSDAVAADDRLPF